MSIFTSILRPTTAPIHEQQLNKSLLYSIPLRLFLSSLAESASVNVSFTATLGAIFDGDGGCCVDWAAFEDWLRRRGLSEKHIRHCLSYGRRYVGFLLGKRNLNEIEGLRGKRKILAALSNLARFLGIYGKWRSMLHDAGVSWSNNDRNGEWVFRRIYDGEIEGLSSWLMILREKAEEWLWDYVVFLGLSGLRPSEAITALNLVKDGKLRNYMNEETYVLEHFRFPRLFFRNGKKCYVTVLTGRMVSLLEKWETVGRILTYGVVRGKIERLGLNMRLYHLRKNFATFLWKKGVPVELIDLCQGRCGATVFAKHYFRPIFHEEAEKIRNAVEELENEYYSKMS